MENSNRYVNFDGQHSKNLEKINQKTLVLTKSVNISLSSKSHNQVNNAKSVGTALNLAASRGEYDVVSLLIDYKVAVNEKWSNGRTALMLALKNGHSEIANLLLDNGANVNDKDEIKPSVAPPGVLIFLHAVDWAGCCRAELLRQV